MVVAKICDNWPPLGEPRPVRRPSLVRRIGAVVALGDIVEAVLGFLVEREIGEADIAAALLVEQGDQPGPQRGDSAGSPDNPRLPIKQDVVTGLG